MLRVVAVSLLLFVLQSSQAISQRPVPPDKAVEALRMQDTFRLGVIPGPRRADGRVVVEQIYEAEIDREVEAKQQAVQLAIAIIRSNSIEQEAVKLETMRRFFLTLQENAEARIPRSATAEQRAKLRAAAVVDIRRRTTEFSSRIATENLRFVNQLASTGGLDIFGPESLFAKVMSHQGLKVKLRP